MSSHAIDIRARLHQHGRAVDLTTLDPPSSMLAGEAFLERIFNAYRNSTSESGSNVWNTALLIGWDEPGGTYDHVPPGPASVMLLRVPSTTCSRWRRHATPTPG